MSRDNLSQRFISSLNSSETDEVYVALLTIEHLELAGEVWRVSSDNRDLLDYEEQLRGTISRQQNFSFLPMEFSLPDQKAEAEEMLEIRLSNVTQELMPILESVRTPANVDLEIVLASDPDDVEILFPEMQLISAVPDAGSVTLTLAVDNLTRENYPSDPITPGGFPALWATT